MIMTSVEIASTRTLSGNAARPLSVSGDTTAPSEMPTRTEMTRDSGTGICTGRPHSAAVATPSSEPVTRPAGKPSQFNAVPPTAAIASVSAARSHSFFAGIGRDAIGAINAAPGLSPSNPSQRLDTARKLLRGCGGLVPRPLPQHDPHQVGGILGAELVHDAGAMHLDGARADAERAAGLLVGGPGDDPGQHLALARGQQPGALDLGQIVVSLMTLGQWPPA